MEILEATQSLTELLQQQAVAMAAVNRMQVDQADQAVAVVLVQQQVVLEHRGKEIRVVQVQVPRVGEAEVHLLLVELVQLRCLEVVALAHQTALVALR
jgi:hypothetical protein